MTNKVKAAQQNRHWHAIEAGNAAQRLQVDPARGLDAAEVSKRQALYGPNTPSQRHGRGPLLRLLLQFVQPLVLVLVVAGAVTAALGEWIDSSVIFAVVLINAVVGFLQEGKAEAALAALARVIATEASVTRDARRTRIDAVQLVPGDVVHLAAGDKVPADLRLLHSRELRTAEAALTGESTPIDKNHAPLPAPTPLADRRNMAYTGTLVVAGRATGVVVATGDDTETGRIARLIGAAPDLATPLTRKMGVFAQRLLVAILLLAALTFAVGVWRGQPLFDMFIAAVALAVGAIPEGLPAAMTITLAIGVARMAKRRAIIRKLPAVETLGSTTVICSDKTGTLTQNEMVVREAWAGGARFTFTGNSYAPEGRIEHAGLPVAPRGALRAALVAAALCNDARLRRDNNQWVIDGDPTEGALITAARKADLDEDTLNAVFPRRDELSFDAARQFMATLHEVDGQHIVYAKGAIEKLLPACTTMLDDDDGLVGVDVATISKVAVRMAEEGLRVLALARSELSPDHVLTHEHLREGLVFLGLVAMIDPPRPRAISAVRTCHAAGIRVKMITGDHPGTAMAVARQLGIMRDGEAALTGRALAALDDDALRSAAARADVFARVEPEQKLRLVQALQANGEVVAMTGDGVNDAPALRQADIGVAMGLGGTEVAKEAAEMVLTDDNFASIEAAVEEGRGIFDNLVKFIAWTIPTNAGEGLVILVAVFAGTALPITPLQILWINMSTAILLGMSLAFEPAEPGIMRRPPRPPAAPILDRGLMLRILLVSLLMLGGAFGLFELAVHQDRTLEEARTLATNVFVAIETAYLFSCRSLDRAPWALDGFGNPWVWAGSLAMLALQIGFTYLPWANRIFQTTPLGAADWAMIAAIAASSFLIVEFQKGLTGMLRRRAARMA
ncbi:MAG: HAD-IC family P-type ATPase [Thauera phenolivorans]|uniref:HAD-IC family P-type ATPase n=1 Tax=Thauera phenolivorans TaxID=1792543 RepID=A0A7X7LTC2_9RHOO|nr:HAD-IC family P-type ATPase [Thauera phenolivorans]